MAKEAGLTPKQEAFCKAYLETGNASAAYRQSYSVKKATPKSVNEVSSRLLSEIKISSRIEELKAEITKNFVWERKDSLEVLREIARAETLDSPPAHRDRIAAVKELNSMHGYNAPVKSQLIGADGNPLNLNINISFVKPGEVDK